jgi:Domain of unknown function (DUF4150)
MFVNGNGPMPGMLFGAPDVCKVPVLGAPVPMPMVNIGLTPTAVPTQMVVFTMCMPSHNMMTMIDLTEGDEPGIEGGLISQLDMATAECEMGSTNLFLGGPPAIKLTSPTGQNGIVPNAPGAVIVPSQILFLSLS